MFKDIVHLYSKCELTITNFKLDLEPNDYEACSFRVSDFKIVFRKAKITPKKVGQFVAIWKRALNGETRPYDVSDDFDFFMIQTKNESNNGYFIFSKKSLLEYNVISQNYKSGKRGMRMYPSWDRAINNQAVKTQKWQLQSFVEVNEEGCFDNDNIFEFYQ
jgi:hypothetical protein